MTRTIAEQIAAERAAQDRLREANLAAVTARARYIGINTIDFTDLFTVEIGGQDEDVVITRETAEHLRYQLNFLLGDEEDA